MLLTLSYMSHMYVQQMFAGENHLAEALSLREL